MALHPLYPKVYPIFQEGSDFYFFTDQGARYQVYFTDGQYYFEGASFASEVVMFGFARLNRATARPFNPSDSRIAATIISLLWRTVESNPATVILYVCSQQGNSQKHRFELFNRWLAEWQDWQDGCLQDVEKLDYTDGNTLYVSCLFLNRNPYAEAIKEEFPRKVKEKEEWYGESDAD